MTGRIGFVGLGNMGLPMARRLLGAGFGLIVNDVRQERVDALKAPGADVRSGSLQEIGSECRMVITMLPSGDIVRDAVLGEAGLAHHMAANSIIVDMSSADVEQTRTLGAALAEKGINFIDAPVAGGVGFAQNGTLIVTAGGDAATIATCTPVLEAMASEIFHCGRVGSGHLVKALNNFVNAVAMNAALEALVVARASGIDTTMMIDAMAAATTGRNHPLDKKVRTHVLTRSFSTGMSIGLIAKDLRAAQAAAKAGGVEAPVADLTTRIWERGETEIGKGRDQTEISALWERQAGIEIVGGQKATSAR